MVIFFLNLPKSGQDTVHVVGLVGVTHGLLKGLEFVVQVAQASGSGYGLIQDGTTGHLFHILPKIPNGQLFWDRHFPFVGRFLSHDHAEQGGLARPVGTDQPHLVAGVELEIGVHEEDLPPVLLGNVRKGDHNPSMIPVLS